MSARLRLSAGLAMLLCLATGGKGFAAGPLIVNGAGQPLTWAAAPIPYNPDRGTLGVLDNPSAMVFVSDRFATWAAVPTASISFTNAGVMPVDVTAANVGAYFGGCGDGLNPIIFDTDGSIIRTLFGIGNENVILGAAGPECGTYTPPVITDSNHRHQHHHELGERHVASERSLRPGDGDQQHAVHQRTRHHRRE